ncbi:MAG: hypothetical protein QOE10_1005 [Gaiellales bacterium]|nr:hypothetical protein [Gaiellales bacterium]
MKTVRIATVAATLALVGAALIGAPAASAKGGDGVKVRGTCTQSSSAKLKLSREDSGIQIEFEVDQNRNAVPWRVTLQRNGSQIASATATTRAPSGSFEFRRLTPGGGTFVASASRVGERCTVTASI